VTLRGWLGLFVVMALVGITFVSWPRFESEGPMIAEQAPLSLGKAGAALTISVADEGSGLRSLEARLQHAGGTTTLAGDSFRGSWMAGGSTPSAQLEIALDPGALGLADGPASIVVIARDWSLRDTGSGNRSELVIPLVVDTRPPRIAIESGLTYVARGGSGVAVYSVDEATERDGVMVGEVFYRGYPLASSPGRQVSFFAVPVHAETDPTIDVVATDDAGNQSKRGFPARVVERRFSDSRISLSPRFLERVAVPLADSFGFDSSDPTSAFSQVNEVGRAKSEEQIRGIIKASSPDQLWSGAFKQLQNSKVTSQFAESRSYIANGKKVSAATHYGFDLASTARDAITSSNSGVVLFTGPLGIYGDTVLVDHGQGLVSLYAHLSQIDVEVGDAVETGQPLGLSGATGLAGGDHLHFAILVGSTYVDPLEWWDASWVRSHVEVRVTATGG
jgi:murein DD-endopeptidase MepM/ murein hydrolase activator NlpD